MTKGDIQQLIVTLEVGQDVHLYLSDKREIYAVQYQIEQAKKFGYKIVFKKLYDNKFYFEIVKEGDKSRILKIIEKHERNDNPESERDDNDEEAV